MSRKVLILTTNFFPDPLVGAVRMTQWAKLLPEHGWQVVVARKHHGFVATVEELAQEVHPQVEVRFLNNAPQPFSMQRAGRFSAVKKLVAAVAGRYLLAPDTGIVFWNSAFAKIEKLVDEIRPDVIITTGPPHSLHNVGLRLKERHPDLRWIADLRDVYGTSRRYNVGWPEYFKNRRSLRHEAAVYRVADHITTTLPAHQRWMRKRHPITSGKVTTLTNGVPPSIEESLRLRQETQPDDWVKVVGFSEAPETISLARAVRSLRDKGAAIGLRIIGREPSVKPAVMETLEGGADFTGAVPHAAALAEICSARILVAVLSERRSRIPAIASKLFEYLAVPAPVIILNPSNAARTLFSRLPGVWMLAAATPEDIEATLAAALAMPADLLEARARAVREKWGRENQVRELVRILEGLYAQQYNVDIARVPAE